MKYTHRGMPGTAGIPNVNWLYALQVVYRSDGSRPVYGSPFARSRYQMSRSFRTYTSEL